MTTREVFKGIQSALGSTLCRPKKTKVRQRFPIVRIQSNGQESSDQFLESHPDKSCHSKKLKEASDAEAVAIAKIANEAGFDIPVEELKIRGRWGKISLTSKMHDCVA